MDNRNRQKQFYLHCWHTLGNLDGLTNNGWYDGFLAKYTSDGDKQWTKLIGTNAQEGIYSVVTNDDEFLYIAGHTGSNALVSKYSLDGTEHWRESLGSGRWDAAWSISLGPSGDIYVAGNTEGSFNGQTNQGADDGFLTKYDASGGHMDKILAHLFRSLCGQLSIQAMVRSI